MKIITEPSVYLISSQQLHNDAILDFLQQHNTNWIRSDEDAEECAVGETIAEFGGRLCYMSFDSPRPGGNAAYIEHIKESGHGSVLEHVVYTFCITGVSRTLTHELVRHRQGLAYSQLSQRYVDESVAEYVIPDIIREDEELYSLWLQAVETSHQAYLTLVEKLNWELRKRENERKLKDGLAFNPTLPTELRKTARQAARSVLPNATETKILMTVNARALRHILEQRGSRFAEPEIRKLAYALYRIAFDDAPHLFGDYTVTPLPDGTHELNTKTRKV